MDKRLLVSFLVLFFFIAADISFAEDIREYFIKQDTFFYLYLNAEKVQNSKIYGSANKYLIQENYRDYSKLINIASKIGLTEKDVSEIYFSSTLKNVKVTADIKQDTVYSLSGIVLKKGITIDKLLNILKEFLKNDPNVSVSKIKQANYEIIQVKTELNSIYVGITQSKLVLTCNDLSEFTSLMNSYKAKKNKPSTGNISWLLSQVSQSASLYAVIVFPPFMAKEFEQLNNQVKQVETEDVRYKVSNAIRNLKGLAVVVGTDDTLTLKINTFFTTEGGVKSFNELINQFMPLIKFQLFIMVRNSTLPVLNTMTTAKAEGSISLSANLINDDFVSINQMIKNKGKPAGF